MKMTISGNFEIDYELGHDIIDWDFSESANAEICRQIELNEIARVRMSEKVKSRIRERMRRWRFRKSGG